MRRRVSIAFDAVQSSTDELTTTMFGRHPRSDLPGRVVPNVLAVAAFEVRNPMRFFVLVKTDDPTEHQDALVCEPGPGRISMYVDAGNSVVNPKRSYKLLAVRVHSAIRRSPCRSGCARMIS